ncbi:MAG: transposase [Mesorhizobium sp.]|uniref:Insertion element IS402-like domain-containing protein n=1 Tax=Mesorhizobium mediterraneum TaxID=43617 RepID=A0AB36R749_9HYPH|nr:hypothetical protein CIT25_19040 [Mesorhizobium mediterraneum]RWN24569.1 MAG: transposase [Mesorhizobium sp.]RWN32550.1 MAG: transposase [Mesorhizobium sp.]RWN48704.1 MAG: transposase [Mesorhizobium sp.]RWN51544.1 MAG: transposase [Mesorhizobium sp.]
MCRARLARSASRKLPPSVSHDIYIRIYPAAALGERIGVSDEEWALIGPLLPAERGRGCRPAQDNRRYFEGMMWMARTGAQWRHLPDEYGKWNSVFRRYRRWVATGVFDALLETLAEMA